jgi:hypothetical protein
MSDQSYAKHAMYVPAYHYYTFGAWVALFLWAAYRLVRDFSLDHLMMLVLIMVLAMGLFFSRLFAVRAQDRVIRLEERLRLARLLPDPLKPRIDDLSVNQLVAIRFASDGEVSELVSAVLQQNVTEQDQIKRMIKTWRPDHARF